MSFIVFLDANVLAKPFTRSLMWAGSKHSGFSVTWSRYVEDEASRHLRPHAMGLGVLRERFGQVLSADGDGAQRFTATSASDRKVLADAVAAGARFLVTEDIDDFDEGDLAIAGVTAIHPDVFLSQYLSDAGYLAAVSALSTNSRNPQRSASDVHGAGGRLHPQLVRAKAHLFPGISPDVPTQLAPRIQMRGPETHRSSLT